MIFRGEKKKFEVSPDLQGRTQIQHLQHFDTFWSQPTSGRSVAQS